MITFKVFDSKTLNVFNEIKIPDFLIWSCYKKIKCSEFSIKI